MPGIRAEERKVAYRSECMDPKVDESIGLEFYLCTATGPEFLANSSFAEVVSTVRKTALPLRTLAKGLYTAESFRRSLINKHDYVWQSADTS